MRFQAGHAARTLLPAGDASALLVVRLAHLPKSTRADVRCAETLRGAVTLLCATRGGMARCSVAHRPAMASAMSIALVMAKW